MTEKQPNRRACPTMKTQLLRGLTGVLLLVAAALVYETNIWIAIALVAISVVPLKGCPVCWLVETCEVARQPGEKKKTEEEQ